MTIFMLLLLFCFVYLYKKSNYDLNCRQWLHQDQLGIVRQQ